MKPIAILLLIASIALISCGDDDPTGNDNNNDTTDTSQTTDTIADGLTMKVNGSTWTGMQLTLDDPLIGGGAVIKEVNSWKGTVNKSESISLGLISLEKGTYPVSSSGSDATINFVANENTTGGFLGDPVVISSGSIEIVESTQDRIAGRFSFSGTSQGGTSYTVTDGTFGVYR